MFNTLSSYFNTKNEYLNNTYYLNNIDIYKKQLARIEKELQDAPKKIINNLSHILLLNKCSRFANDLNIDIISYTPINPPSKKNPDYKEVSIELNIKTDYLNLAKFINKIETRDFISNIDKLEIYRIEPYSSRVKSKIIITGFTISEKQ